MILFVNNIPIHVLEMQEDPVCSQVIDLETEILRFNEVSGRSLIRNATHRCILDFVTFLQQNPDREVEEVFFSIKDRQKFKTYLRRECHFVKAAGGVVANHEGKVLMMKRLGFWDLPKGKADKGEKAEVTAVREVEEECNITVFVDQKLVTTWHTYSIKGKLVIKRTKWYEMKLISDQKMRPQTEEGIEELVWMGPEEVAEALKHSYRSIVYVLDTYSAGSDSAFSTAGN